MTSHRQVFGSVCMSDSGVEIMGLLSRLKRGDRSAEAELVPLVLAELRRLADGLIEREGPHSPMQAEALLQEAWLRIVTGDCPDWQSPAHFFAVAKLMMRRILVDHARAKWRARRPESPG